ncbi:hypothetical protein BU15DRAFT_70675 [Melanogaster broomeanus]|nr:hypothetical protein BU15DRAFT_70675 [Melanogaster broomeanus]
MISMSHPSIPPQPPTPELQVPLGEIAETVVEGAQMMKRTPTDAKIQQLDQSFQLLLDKLEVSDYYDFTTSYPTEASRRKKETKLADDEDWEDVEDDSCSSEDLDEVDDPSASESDDSESLPDNQLTYGDTEYELVLPSGARIGHRSMKRYYSQSLHTDKNSALVPRKGGFGAFDWGPKQSKQGIKEKLARQVVMYENLEIKDGGKTSKPKWHSSTTVRSTSVIPCYNESALCAISILSKYVASGISSQCCSQTYRAGSGTIVYQVDLDK